MDVLIRIKRLVIARRVVFTEKAEVERDADNLTPETVYEAILNALAIYKKIRSRDPVSGQRENLYVIIGLTFDGQTILPKEKSKT